MDFYTAPPPPPLREHQGRNRLDTILVSLLLAIVIGFLVWRYGWPGILQVFAASAWRLGAALPWVGPTWFPATHAPPWPAPAPWRPGPAPPGPPGFGWIGPLLRTLGLLAGLGGAALGVSRWAQRVRRARTMTWYEIRLWQHDVTNPQAVRALFDTLWDALYPRSRWVGSWAPYRWAVGADPFTVLAIRDPALDEGRYIHLLLGAPAASIHRVLQIWQNVYQNVRFEPWRHPIRAAWPQVLRWGIRYRSPLRLTDLVSSYETIPLEILIQAVAREAWRTPADLPTPDQLAFCLAWTFWPAATHRARRQLEAAAQWAEWTQDTVAQSAARTALTQVGRGRWATDWRAGVGSYDVAQRIVGALGVHNRWAALTPHNVILWRRPMARWMSQGLPNPPGLAHGPTLWSAECATFFALPTGRLRVAELRRSTVRRMPAPRTLPRDPDRAFVKAEGDDRVGLWDEDWAKNMLLLGLQGSGKSTHLLNIFARAVRARRPVPGADPADPDPPTRPAEAVVLFDIGKDTAQAALSLVPPDRRVIRIAPAEDANPWALPLLSGAADPATQVGHILDLLVDLFGREAIGPRSRQILHHLLATAIAAASPQQPDVISLAYQCLTDPERRTTIIAQAKASGRLDRYTDEFWKTEFPHMMAQNAAFWEEAMAAPRNKLHELLRHRAVRSALGAADVHGYLKRVVNWDRVLRERQVVILDLSLEALGADTLRLFGAAALLNLWHALERQGRLPEAERVPVRILIDEAQQFLTPSFLTLLALGRAYGLRAVLATRFLSEIRDPQLRAGIEDLCQNLIVHRTRLEDEAVRLMKQMMTVYINNITLQEEAQALERFMADDFFKLPDRTAICLWQARGEVQTPFLAETLDWRDDAHPDWADHHRRHQPALTVVWDDAEPDTPDAAPAAAPTADAPASDPADPVPADPAAAVPPTDPAPASPPPAIRPQFPTPPPPPPEGWTPETLARRWQVHPRVFLDAFSPQGVLDGVDPATVATWLAEAEAAGTLPRSLKSRLKTWLAEERRRRDPAAS